ncbi:hypothetical protein FOT59_20480 [Serratia nevei]|nr:hypothetical protein FOT59_20480 [Serratia nevei]
MGTFSSSLSFAVMSASVPLGQATKDPLGKRKISYAKPVFCTDYYPLSVMNGIAHVPLLPEDGE